MNIYANKGFSSFQRKFVQFGEYPVTKSAKNKQSKFISSNGYIPGSSVEFGEYEKTTTKKSMNSEYNPSEIDILQTTNYADNLQDNQNLENYVNEPEQINSTFEVSKTENFTGQENVQFGEYPSTYGINTDESSYKQFSNFEESTGEYINSNIISENLEFNNYQITDSNININTIYQPIETTENFQDFENVNNESNNYSQTAYEFNSNGNNAIDNVGQTYDEYQSTTKIDPFETGFGESNYIESTPMIEDYQLNDQKINTSGSINTLQIAFGLPEIEKKTNYINYSKYASVTPLMEINYSSEGYEATEPYLEAGTIDYNYNYQINENENDNYVETTTSYDDTYKHSEQHTETGTTFEETSYQTSEPYFETSTTLNTNYQISEPYVENETNEVFQIAEPEITENVDYTSFNIETSQAFDSITYPSNEPIIEEGKAFDENIYQSTESYTETEPKINITFNQENEQYVGEPLIPSDINIDNIDTISTFIETSSDLKTDYFTEGYEGFENTSYQINEPIIETSSTVETTTYGEPVESFDFYNVSENYDKNLTEFNTTDSNYLETEQLTENITNYDETPFTISEKSNYLETEPLTENLTNYDENTFPINEPYFETATTLDTTSYLESKEKTGEEFNYTNYEITEPYETTENLDDNIYKTSEPYFEISTTIETTENLDDNIYKTSEPYFETSTTIGTTENLDDNIYKTSEPYFETSATIETTETFDDNIYKTSEPYFETSTTIDTPDYQTTIETPDYQTTIETPINYELSEKNIETKSFDVNYQINEQYSETSTKKDNQINEQYGEIITTFDNRDYQSIEPYTKTNIELGIDDYTNIVPGIEVNSTLETSAYTTNSQDVNILSNLEKEKTPDIISYESKKPEFDLQTYETKSYEGTEIYDFTDNFDISKYKTSTSPIIESIPNFEEKKEENTSTLKDLDNKLYETTETYQVTEPITNNFDFGEYKKSEPIIETKSTTTYQEYKPLPETTSTIETTTFTNKAPSLEEKKLTTTITTFETSPEFDFSSYTTNKVNDIKTKINPIITSNVTTKNIIPEYSNKTYKEKRPVIKTEFDFTNLGTSSNYNTGIGYNKYKTTTSKTSHQKIKSEKTLPTTYTTIKTVSKPVKTSTITNFIQSTPSYNASNIYKDYQTYQNLKEINSASVPKKQVLTTYTTIPTQKVTKTEYISGPKITSYSKPKTISSKTKPYKFENLPIPFTLSEPIIPSVLNTGATFGEYKTSKKQKNLQSVYYPTYNQKIIKSSTPKSLVPYPKISMVPQISIVPPPQIPIKKKKKDPIIVKIPKIQKVYVPKIKKVIIPKKKKIYINKPSTIYVPKPSLSIIKTSPIYAPVQAVSKYPLKSYSSSKILKYNQNIISQIPSVNAVVPIQTSVQLQPFKYSNKTYIAPGYNMSNLYSGSTFNSAKSRNNLNFVGNIYKSKTYQARKL